MNPSTGEQDQTLRYLGRWRRLAGFLIEAIIWGITSSVMQTFEEPWETITGVILITIHTLYRAWMVSQYGGVLGHLAVQARIVDHKTGQPVTQKQATARALMGLLGLMIIPIIINMIMVLARQDRRHLYDLVAGTAVIEFHSEQTEREPRQANNGQPMPADD